MMMGTLNIYLDVHQFRNHIMTHRESAERLKNDIKIAAKLGFKDEKYADYGIDSATIERMNLNESSVKPEDIIDTIPYIISIHGKFYKITEIPGKPGCYEDLASDYETPIKYLKENGFDGYINSEYKGQRDQQDRGIEFLADEVEQVRRHHEMLSRLIG